MPVACPPSLPSVSPNGHAPPTTLGATRARGCSPWAQCGMRHRLHGGEQGVLGSRTPGLGGAAPGSAWSRDVVLPICVSVRPFRGRAQGTRGCCLAPCLPGTGARAGGGAAAPAALSRSRVASALTAGQGDLGKGVPSSPHCLCRAGHGHSSVTVSVRDRLWICSGGTWARGSPSHPAIGSGCPRRAGSLQEKHTEGRP